MNSKAYPFMGLGSSLNPLIELGLPSFFFFIAGSSLLFSHGVRLFVPFWALVQHGDFLDLNKGFKKLYIN